MTEPRFVLFKIICSNILINGDVLTRPLSLFMLTPAETVLNFIIELNFLFSIILFVLFDIYHGNTETTKLGLDSHMQTFQEHHVSNNNYILKDIEQFLQIRLFPCINSSTDKRFHQTLLLWATLIDIIKTCVSSFECCCL